MAKKFSIIIPVKAINSYVRETVPHIQNLKRQDWELIVLPNEQEPNEWYDSRIRIVPSGLCGPAKKRDIGSEIAIGEILVFLDDDSYPENNFLDIAQKYFDDESVVALGGPAMTPRTDSYWQRVSGAVFLSKLSGGAPERYVPTGDVKEVNDWPSVNLMVRREDFIKIGGFNSPYWPGEDTKLCLDLVKITRKRILYIPCMHVWHHRREGLMKHLEQIGNYALHRGFFVKKYPENSRKLLYFIPLFFVAFVFISIPLTIASKYTMYAAVSGWVIYFFSLIIAYKQMLNYESHRVCLMGVIYTIFTHLWYGVRFGQGLLTRDLKSKLR